MFLLMRHRLGRVAFGSTAVCNSCQMTLNARKGKNTMIHLSALTSRCTFNAARCKRVLWEAALHLDAACPRRNCNDPDLPRQRSSSWPLLTAWHRRPGRRWEQLLRRPLRLLELNDLGRRRVLRQRAVDDRGNANGRSNRPSSTARPTLCFAEADCQNRRL